MFTAKVRNSKGNELTLTGREAEFQIIRIEGLNPPPATVNVTPLVAMDGGRFNSARLETRELVITVRLNGAVETNRLTLYSYFRTKMPVRFFYTNDTLDVFIDGYVASVEADYFSSGEVVQISILCPFPYFSAIDAIIEDSNHSIAGFTFPFTIEVDHPVVISSLDAGDGEIELTNASDAEAGFLLTIDLDRDCGDIIVKNLTSGGTLHLSGSFLAGDSIKVSTVRGQKSILIFRAASIVNGFYTLADGSEFWQLLPGTNIVEYLIDDTPISSSAVLTFEYRQNYRGV